MTRAKSLDDRLYTAMAQAEIQRQERAGDLIEVHVGQEVFDYLKTLTSVLDNPRPGLDPAMFFGFPLFLEERARPDHISVHVVYITP